MKSALVTPPQSVSLSESESLPPSDSDELNEADELDELDELDSSDECDESESSSKLSRRFVDLAKWEDSDLRIGLREGSPQSTVA
ncbi:hypothetical protein U1Q18_051179 [Sarracenia purpurea var. burkii]